MAAANNQLGKPAAAAAASRAVGDGGPPPTDVGFFALFIEATAAIAAATVVPGSNRRCSGGCDCGAKGGDRSSAPHGSGAVGGVDDDRLPGSGSGLSALRLPPLKLPVSDDGSCEHDRLPGISYNIVMNNGIPNKISRGRGEFNFAFLSMFIAYFFEDP